MLLDDYSVLSLRSRAGYAHDWWSNAGLTAQFVSLPTTSFTVTGVTPAPNAALTSAAAEFQFVHGLALGLRFDGEFAAGSSTYGAKGTIRYAW